MALLQRKHRETVGDLEYPQSIALYGGPSGSGAALLRLAGELSTWGRVDVPGAGLTPGFYYARARADASLATGWWASILLYRVAPTLEATAADRGTSGREFEQIGEFEAATDIPTAVVLQTELERSRANRQP